MEILFHGQHTHKDLAAAIEDVLYLLHDRWNVQSFNDLHLSLILTDDAGFEVELMDSNTHQDLRVLNVYPKTHSYVQKRKLPNLRLI